jgi:hypothetical protein
MIKLALNPELVLTELKTWRDATLMTRHRTPPHRDNDSGALGARMIGAAERLDGFLMLLQSCSTSPEDAGELTLLVGELHDFRDWVQQGQYAAKVLQTLPPVGARKRTSGRRH